MPGLRLEWLAQRYSFCNIHLNLTSLHSGQILQHFHLATATCKTHTFFLLDLSCPAVLTVLCIQFNDNIHLYKSCTITEQCYFLNRLIPHCSVQLGNMSVSCVCVIQAYTSQFVALTMFGLMMSEDRLSLQKRRLEIINSLRVLPGQCFKQH